MDITQFIKLNTPPVTNYRRIILDDNWSLPNPFDIDPKDKVVEDSPYERFELQHSIVEGVYDRVKTFVDLFGGERKKKVYREFLELCNEILYEHLDRCEYYVNSLDLSIYPTIHLRQDAVKANKDVYKKSSTLREKMSNINLTTEEEKKVIEFIKDQQAPLILHDKLKVIFPEIETHIKNLGVNFNRKPEPFLHINNDNAPVWEKDKHYFEQEPEVLQYYVDEWNKIKNGIKIGETYISGWMYYHINYFVTKYPGLILNEVTGKEETGDITGVPPLRDNEWWVINDNYELAKEQGKMMFIAATRRAAKTTMNTSHLGWATASGKSRLLVAGGSQKDIGQIGENFEILQQNIHPAFSLYGLLEDWEKQVTYGVRLKTGKALNSVIIKIVNLDAGSSKKSESLAGFTPEAVIIDEIMKLAFKPQLAALKPAIDSPFGKRCVVILTGTSGNSELAKDAFDVLRKPDVSDILNMPWDVLNSRVPEEYRTWKERDFGTFIPAQMSSKDGMVKDDSNLSEFLNIKNTELEKVKIQVTNWKTSIDKVKEDRLKLKDDIVEYTKEVLYYPICPSDMLLSGKINPFPVQEAIMQRERLLSEGGAGKKVTLMENGQGVITYSQNNDELASYPHKGGFIDCPVVLYEDLPLEMPPDNLYIAGQDDYKQEESTTDSIGAFHIYKVDAGFDKNCGTIVASLATRPDPHSKFHHQMYMLQRAFNAKCFMENADTDYQTFLELRRVADIWLVEAIDFDGEATMKNTGRRKYGWNPSSKKNKDKLFSLFVAYTKRRFTEEDEEGNIHTYLGVQKIKDIGLLDEIIAYKEGNNVDRITSMMSCLGYEFYLYCNHMFPDITRQLERRRDMQRSDRNSSRRRNSNPFFSTNKKPKFF